MYIARRFWHLVVLYRIVLMIQFPMVSPNGIDDQLMLMAWMNPHQISTDCEQNLTSLDSQQMLC